MKTRTALVACADNHEGVWAFVRGNETGVHITGLAAGERVVLVLDSHSAVPQKQIIFDAVGTFPVDFSRWNRYKIGKLVRAGVKTQPTTVEVVLGELHVRA